MRILLAEDDQTSMMILVALLKKWGHDPVTVDNGGSAYAVLRADDAPRMAILDWMMPGMDGLDVCRMIRREEREPPPYLIVLTTRNEKDDLVRGFDAGADDFMGKPFDPRELCARIEVGQRMIAMQDRLAKQLRDLKASMDQIKTLRGIIPICSYCKKVRDDQGYWDQVEAYISHNTDAVFSHGVCPECKKKVYTEFTGEELNEA